MYGYILNTCNRVCLSSEHSYGYIYMTCDLWCLVDGDFYHDY
jgi:hypothetical protein